MRERLFSEYRETKEKEYKELSLIKQDLEVINIIWHNYAITELLAGLKLIFEII